MQLETFAWRVRNSTTSTVVVGMQATPTLATPTSWEIPALPGKGLEQYRCIAATHSGVRDFVGWSHPLCSCLRDWAWQTPTSPRT